MERDHAAHNIAIEGAPKRAGRKHALAIEPLVFFGRVQTDEPGQSVVERSPVNARGGFHVGQQQPPRLHWMWGFAVSSIPSAFITAIVVFKVGLPFVLNER